MAQTSIFWTTGSTGDGTNPYTQSQLFDWLRRTFTSDNYASEGPLRGFGGELAVTAASGSVNVADGAAYVYGIPYLNDAVVNIPIPTPTSNTRIDRIVLRADWTAQTVRITRIAGTEGAAAPAITQTPNSIYDVKLAQVSITTGGVITVTDERVFAHFATAVRTENLDDASVTTAKIADGAVTSQKIADGTIVDADISAGAAIAQSKISNATRAIDADMVDGQHGAFYQSRANHTGTQAPNTISPQGSGSGLDADSVDGLHLADLDNRFVNEGQASSISTAMLQSGAVTPAKQSTVPRCRLRKSTNQTIPNNTTTTVAFDVVDYDTDTMADTANNRVIIKTAGIYLISASIRWAQNGNGFRAMSPRINGTVATLGITQTPRADSIFDDHNSWVQPLNVNDTVILVTLQTSGGNVDILAQSNYSPTLEVVWLGPL